ncbi:class I SAM-dependent methyltransferase [Candidatus Roizmanbacteria bacterium]|nr:MAG: class I SAM-dependent methyltransferase [Candidatus Roizmanbacteria bacterium]
MKTKFVMLSHFQHHPHPASKLFRTIELQNVYKNTKRMVFKQPSMDLGGGDGYLSSILFDSKFTYNLDNGEANDLHVAKRTKRYKKILIESAEKMSLRYESLNFIFSNSVIEHIPDNEAVLQEVARTLKKGGAFVFTSPSHNFKHYLWLSNVLERSGLGILGKLYLEKRNKMLNHYHTYSHATWTKKLKTRLNCQKATIIFLKTCMLWDKIAWEVRIRAVFDRNAEKNVFLKYKEEIENAILDDRVANNKGASVFIYAVKK